MENQQQVTITPSFLHLCMFKGSLGSELGVGTRRTWPAASSKVTSPVGLETSGLETSPYSNASTVLVSLAVSIFLSRRHLQLTPAGGIGEGAVRFLRIGVRRSSYMALATSEAVDRACAMD